MRTVLTRLALTGIVALSPLKGLAEDVALLLSQSDYRHISDPRESARAQALTEILQSRGFVVFSGNNIDAKHNWEMAEQFREAARDADRVFVFLAGHVVSSSNDTWLLTTFVKEPSDFSVGFTAIPLQPILNVATQHPGQAVVMIAPSGQKIDLGAGLASGVAGTAVPQGVTLVTGPIGSLIPLAEDLLEQDGISIGEALASPPRGVEVSGFVTDAMPFLSGAEPVRPVVNVLEVALWQTTQAIGTIEAYQGYLDRFPNGSFQREATDAINNLRNEPERLAREAEDRLSLSRDDRRAIQRNLSLLGFDPKGIDGVFGPGSRKAIQTWQRDQGYEANGFLTGNQIASLDQQGTRRAKELEEEAARRQAEQDRLDADYWRETGSNGDETNLRAYLKRYPDGLYAEIAQAKLKEIEDAKRNALAAEERAFWDEVAAAGTVDGYTNYLKRYPNGAFAETARAELDKLATEAGNAAAVAAAKQEEDRVAGSQITRLLAEQRLAALGYKIGAADGQFDEATRRAIRQFQRSRDLPVTGYITQGTMVHLMIAR